MAKKISELNPITGSEFASDDQFVMVDKSGNETKRADASEVTAGLGAEGFPALNLTAIAESKAITAVAGFVYDTSLDSDGGAWRTGWRALASSWYWETLNTATRGARREFPAVAVIISEGTKVTVFDGDDPTLPMWMVFNGGSDWDIFFPNLGGGITSIVAKNGVIYGGDETTSGYGLTSVSFIEDAAYNRSSVTHKRFNNNILNRNSNNGAFYTILSSTGVVVNDKINDVAITVLPNAPIDEATGLPTLTIFVFTDGGVSKIKDDDTVESTASGSSVVSGNISGDTVLARAQGGITTTRIGLNETLPAGGASHLNSYWPTNYYTSTIPAVLHGNGVISDKSTAVGANTGLTILAEDTTTPANGMVAYLTSEYNTGWMQGDIKGCLLSSTAITSLVGTELAPDLTTYADQAAAVTDGWTLGTGWTFDAVDDEFDCDGTQTAVSNLYHTSGLPSGEPIILTFVVTNYVAGNVKPSAGSTGAGTNVSTNGTYTETLTVAGSTDAYMIADVDFNGSVEITGMRLAVEDRSVNNNGIGVYGTIARTVVATGAELVAYSGFSATDYLEQPYNADLDFGTGDFHVMGWVKATIAGRYLFQRLGGGAVYIYIDGSGFVEFGTTTAGADYLKGTTDITNAGWVFVCGVRRSGVKEVHVNGALEGTSSYTGDVSGTAPVLTVGVSGTYAGPLAGSLALFRIGAGAPSAAQIAKMYEDEKHLFQENALATISADAVTALAVDPFTGLLEVGTAGDIDTVSGITPISRSTDNGATFISVADKLRISQ